MIQSKISLIQKAIEDKKGENIEIFDVDKSSPFFTHVVVCTSLNKRAGEAIADEIDRVCASIDEQIKHIEGKNGAEWVLVDCGDILVHIFTEQERVRVNIEQLLARVSRENN